MLNQPSPVSNNEAQLTSLIILSVTIGWLHKYLKITNTSHRGHLHFRIDHHSSIQTESRILYFSTWSKNRRQTAAYLLTTLPKHDKSAHADILTQLYKAIYILAKYSWTEKGLPSSRSTSKGCETEPWITLENLRLYCLPRDGAWLFHAPAWSIVTSNWFGNKARKQVAIVPWRLISSLCFRDTAIFKPLRRWK